MGCRTYRHRAHGLLPANPLAGTTVRSHYRLHCAGHTRALGATGYVDLASGDRKEAAHASRSTYSPLCPGNCFLCDADGAHDIGRCIALHSEKCLNIILHTMPLACREASTFRATRPFVLE